MKKKIIWIVSAILVIIVVMPLIAGDFEKEVLNKQTREQLDGEFIEFSGGVTHYEIKGEKEAKRHSGKLRKILAVLLLNL